jgi:hypothetical protein
MAGAEGEKIELIIDKSFLDGASRREVLGLYNNYFPIMPDVLFLELISTDDLSRMRCFTKLPDSANPVARLPGIGELLRYEIDNGKPCTPLSERCLPERYQFNPRLRDGAFEFLGEVREERDAMIAQIQNEAREFPETCMMVRDFFPEFDGIQGDEWPCATEVARKKVACDSNFVKEIYNSFLEEQNFPSGWPRAGQINGKWAFFRWVQARLLAALRLFLKYEGAIPPNLGAPFWTRAEHSLIDTYYAIFAALAGALASADRAIIEDFKLLSPDGNVVVPNGLRKQLHGDRQS